MFISIKKIKLIIIIILILLSLLMYRLDISLNNKEVQTVMGGDVRMVEKPEIGHPAFKYNPNNSGAVDERFQRPSKQPALALKYEANDFINFMEEPPYVTTKFESPEDVIQAYYAILKDASNMAGYHGGCGTIGLSEIPYPYAYELLSDSTRKKMTLDEFIDSFEGIGYITLLKILPTYEPPLTQYKNIKYIMIEIELITGAPVKKDDYREGPSHFAYYYGLITVQKSVLKGWKIKDIKYVPEDFLCHPMHHWDYNSKFLVDIVYHQWYGIIDLVEKIEIKDSLVYVYAVGKGEKYRFDFVRITNGDDVLLHENIYKDGQWSEVNLLKDEHQYLKFSILNPNLEK